MRSFFWNLSPKGRCWGSTERGKEFQEVQSQAEFMGTGKGGCCSEGVSRRELWVRLLGLPI